MLVDATVLVTGASSGIGRACAEAFARAGARLLLCARRGDRLTELADSLDAEVRTLPLDVRDRAAVSAAVDGLDAAGGTSTCWSTTPGWPSVSGHYKTTTPPTGTA